MNDMSPKATDSEKIHTKRVVTIIATTLFVLFIVVRTDIFIRRSVQCITTIFIPLFFINVRIRTAFARTTICLSSTWNWNIFLKYRIKSCLFVTWACVRCVVFWIIFVIIPCGICILFAISPSINCGF